MFNAYVDDTDGEEHPLTAFGGFIGKLESWEAIDKSWSEANAKNSIAAFHAKNNGPLIPEDLEIVLQHELFMLGALLDSKTYRQYAPKRLSNDFGRNNWAACASSMFKLIGDFLLKEADAEATIFIDCRSDFKPSIQEQWNTKESYIPNSLQLASLTVIDCKSDRAKHPRLQIGDLGANLLCKYISTDRRSLDPFIKAKRLFNLEYVRGKLIRDIAEAHGIEKNQH